VLVTAPWIGALDRLASTPLKLIVFRPGCSYRTRLEGLLAERGITNARRLEFGTLDGIIGCVGAGIGVTLLPRVVVAKAASEGRIALHRLPREAARIETVLIRRRDVFVSTALARFIEIASARLASPARVESAKTRRGSTLGAVKPRKK
jgi:DNA-binding transcriptional LysR family regulator